MTSVQQLDPAGIATVAKAGGFTGQGLVWAVAVALAESGGNTQALNVNAGGSRDRGLWQINDRAHPEVSDAVAFDPVGCAKAAYTISSGGTNWRPWSTYNNGAAGVQLARAQAAVGSSSSSSSTLSSVLGALSPLAGLAGGDPLGALSPIAGAAGAGGAAGSGVIGSVDSLAKTGAAVGSIAIHAAQWIGDPHNWTRVALVAGGSIAVIAGLILLSQSGVGGPVGAVGDAAADAVKTTGKAATTAAKAAAVA